MGPAWVNTGLINVRGAPALVLVGRASLSRGHWSVRPKDGVEKSW